MRINHIYIVLLFLPTSITNLYAQDSIKVLTLDSCIKIALAQSTQILRSQDSVEMTGAALMGAYGQFLPNLNFSGNFSYIGGTNLLTTASPTLINSRVSQMNYQLTNTINIFNGFSENSELQAALVSKSASQYNLDRAKQQITFDITQTYLQVMLDRRVADYAQTNYDASKKREAQLQALTEVGRKSVADLYQQQAETSSDNLFLIQSQDKLKNDIILLFRKMKISETDKYQVSDIPIDTLPLGPQYQNVQDLINKAMDQRPDVKSSSLNISVAQWNVKGYESGYYPRVFFEGGLISNGGYFNQLYVNGVDDLGTQEPLGKALFGQIYGEGLLGLSWNIFDRFYNNTNVSIAKINQHNAEIAYEDITVQVSSEIKQAYNDYLAALQQIIAANSGLIAAQQAYNVLLGEYEVGKATFVELSNAQAALLQAKVNKAQADVGLALQKKIIDYYIGK